MDTVAADALDRPFGRTYHSMFFASARMATGRYGQNCVDFLVVFAMRVHHLSLRQSHVLFCGCEHFGRTGVYQRENIFSGQSMKYDASCTW